MGIEKAEVKIGLAKDLGRKYAEMAKALDKELDQIDGEQIGYKRLASSLKSVFDRVDADLDKGLFEGLGPLEVAKAIKTALVQVGGCIDNRTEEARASKFMAMGRLDGILKASEVVQKVASAEQGKIDALVSALENGASQPVDVIPVNIPAEALRRPLGLRPGSSIAAQRKAEEASQASATEAQEPSSTTSVVGPEEALSQKGVRTSRSTPKALKSGGTAKASKKATTKKT
jgi:hypothetical protein